MKELKFPFAVLGAIGGLITCFFGRLLLKYVSFVITVTGTIVLSNTVVFLIETKEGDGNVNSKVFWLTFVGSSIFGLLLAWLQ